MGYIRKEGKRGWEAGSRGEADPARVPGDKVVVPAGEAHEVVGEVGTIEEAHWGLTRPPCSTRCQ